MQQQQTATAKEKATQPARAGGSKAALSVGIVGIAGVLAALAVFSAVTPSQTRTGTADLPTLAQLPLTQIDAASATLTAADKDRLSEEARNCKAPLALMSVVAEGAGSGTVRIRSGAYVSPAILVTAQRQNVAVPFPAPYGEGKGVLVIEGRATQAKVSLSPSLVVASLDGERPVNVWWPTDEPCRR